MKQKIHIILLISTLLSTSIIYANYKLVNEDEIEQNIDKIEKEIEDKINDKVKLTFDFGYDYVHGEDTPSIGVYLSDIDFKEAYEYHYNECYGVQITGLVDGGNAEFAGLLSDDIIMEFGGVKVLYENHLVNLKQDYKIGDSVLIKVFRDGKEKEINLTFNPKPDDEADLVKNEKKWSVGFGGGGPMVLMPQFDYTGINSYISQFGFNSINAQSGTHFGGYGMGTIGGGWFIGGMGSGMLISESITFDTINYSRSLQLESGFGGVTITKKLPLFTEKLILNFSTLIGGGETILTISQNSGNFNWGNDEISNGNNWSASYTKKFFALYPSAGLLFRIKSWFGIHASVGNLYTLSTQENWKVSNSDNIVEGISPETPNGLTYSIGLFFGN
ncbi:MAG: PDZ domain-containing protein [Candidatus Marinimicrobia bacterium]|nr:PDZ domain-containing protein [Candidatus Neomarinimicrobiota bacterium]